MNSQNKIKTIKKRKNNKIINPIIITKKKQKGSGKVSNILNRIFRNSRANCKGGNVQDVKLLDYHGTVDVGIVYPNFRPKLGQNIIYLSTYGKALALSDSMKDKIVQYLSLIKFDARKMYKVNIKEEKYKGKILGKGFYSDELQNIVDNLNSSILIDRITNISKLKKYYDNEVLDIDLRTELLKIRFLGEIQFRLHIGDGKTHFNNHALVEKEDKFTGFICRLKQHGKPKFDKLVESRSHILLSTVLEKYGNGTYLIMSCRGAKNKYNYMQEIQYRKTARTLSTIGDLSYSYEYDEGFKNQRCENENCNSHITNHVKDCVLCFSCEKIFCMECIDKIIHKCELICSLCQKNDYTLRCFYCPTELFFCHSHIREHLKLYHHIDVERELKDKFVKEKIFNCTVLLNELYRKVTNYVDKNGFGYNNSIKEYKDFYEKLLRNHDYFNRVNLLYKNSSLEEKQFEILEVEKEFLEVDNSIEICKKYLELKEEAQEFMV